MILAILAIWFGYKKARDTGRNGVLWGAICGATFIGVQFLVSIGMGILIALGVEFWGWKETLYDDLTWVISLVAIGASIVALIILFKFLDQFPEEPIVNEPPPPPPTFNDDQSRPLD